MEINHSFLKDGRNCNITHDMFAYNSDWWDYFNHAVHCVNKMPEAIKSFHVVVRKLEELITSDGFGDEISSFDLRRIKRILRGSDRENIFRSNGKRKFDSS